MPYVAKTGSAMAGFIAAAAAAAIESAKNASEILYNAMMLAVEAGMPIAEEILDAVKYAARTGMAFADDIKDKICECMKDLLDMLPDELVDTMSMAVSAAADAGI